MAVVRLLNIYHKPARYFASDAVIPIQAGRAVMDESSKDGMLPVEDVEWMSSTMIGDDTGDNISSLNRSLNEWTAIYWASRNRPALGNPDYIGFMHYRRHFVAAPNFGADDYATALGLTTVALGNLFNSLDFDFVSRKPITTMTGLHYLANDHGRLFGEELRFALKYVAEHASDIGKRMGAAFEDEQREDGGMTNMFVLPWERFLEYVDILFPALIALMDRFRGQVASGPERRNPGFVAEWMTSFYLSALADELRCLRIPVLTADDLKEHSQIKYWKYRIRGMIRGETEKERSYMMYHRMVETLGRIGVAAANFEKV